MNDKLKSIKFLKQQQINYKLLFNLETLSEWSQRRTDSSFPRYYVPFYFKFSSQNTRRSYLNDLKEFYLFISEKNVSLISDIDDTLLILWQKFLYNRENLSQKSIRRKLIVLSSVFVFVLNAN